MADQRTSGDTGMGRLRSIMAVACTLAMAHLATPTAADAQQRYQQWRGGDRAAQTLVEELNRLIDRAEADRAADPLFFKDLRNAIRQYDSEARQQPRQRTGAPPQMPQRRSAMPAARPPAKPIQVVRLQDDFSDGDFTRNPSWTVLSGRFWVERRRGLRSRVAPPAAATPVAAPQVSSTSIASPRFGTASGSGYRTPVLQAFDADRRTYWESREVGRAIAGRSYIGQDFGAGNARHIGRIYITQRRDTDNGNAYSVDVERRADGEWQTVGRYALSGGGERQVLELPRSGPSTRWRVRATAVVVASRDVRWRVAELEMEVIDQPHKLAAAPKPAAPKPAAAAPAPEPRRTSGGFGGLLGKTDFGTTGGALVDQFMRKKFGRREPAPPPATATAPVKPKTIVMTSARAAALPRPKPVAPAKPQPAMIFSAVEIGNAFTIRADIRVPAGRGRVSLGPYQNLGRTNGYRLVLSPAGRPWLELRTVSAQGSRSIAAVDQAGSDEDRNGGRVEWTRDADGVMTVSMGGRVVLRAVDRGYRDPFRGLIIVNHGGNVLVSSIAVTETR